MNYLSEALSETLEWDSPGDSGYPVSGSPGLYNGNGYGYMTDERKSWLGGGE
jgi:hypothetical protein